MSNTTKSLKKQYEKNEAEINRITYLLGLSFEGLSDLQNQLNENENDLELKEKVSNYEKKLAYVNKNSFALNNRKNALLKVQVEIKRNISIRERLRR